jgi:anaerobic selenocysteine-containing dehydrogenase
MSTRRIPGFCALCRSRCGCISVVEDGRLIAVEPDPSHPTGQALCAKGRAVPELVYHPERLLYPMRRTRPKGEPDPGWQRISWDEALDLAATTLRRLAETHGPETVAFSVTTGAGTAIADAAPWIERLIQTFGGLDHGVGHYRPLSITHQRHWLAYHFIAMRHEGLCQVF